MQSSMRADRIIASRSKGLGWLMGLASLALGGCSADISRFDFPVFGLTEKTDAAPRAPGSSRLSPKNYNSPSSSEDLPPPLASGANPGNRVANAYDPVPPAAAPAPAYDPAPTRPVAAPRPQANTKRAAPGPGPGVVVEVAAGDTLYRIAQRHRVSMDALMKANNLSGPSIRVGQKLILPASGQRGRAGHPSVTAAGSAGQVATAPVAPAAAGPPARAPVVAAVEPIPADGLYQVRQGDSLSIISHRFKVSQGELLRLNGLTDPSKIRLGQSLRLIDAAAGAAPPVQPRAISPVAETASPSQASPPPAPRVAALGKSATGPATRTDAVDDTIPAGRPVAASPPALGATAKFRWPVTGRVIAGFGKRTDGSKNDGINLAVPAGTEVGAAEAGVVLYAGNEMKNYGNIIIIRHDSTWVSAYAHADEMLVKRGDRVARGQIIAKAGKTGQVDQPQLHFELRQASQPIDPTPYMEKN